MGHSRAPSRAETEDEYEDEDNYDWSAEEDLVDEEAKFEAKMGTRKIRKGWGPKRIFTLLFSTLLGSVFLAALLVTPPILLIFFWYKPHPTSERLYILQNVSAWLFWAASNLLVSWFLGFIVDLVPSVLTLAISIAWGHVSETIKSNLELYDSVKDTIKPLFYAASGWASWVILFQGIYKLYNADDEGASRASYTPRLYQVIEFLFFFALVICAQQMLSHAIAFSFHRTAYQERIDSLKEALKVIEVLRNYKPKRSHLGHRSARSTPMLSAMFGADHYFEQRRGGNGERRRVGTPEPLHESPAGSDEDEPKGKQSVRFGWKKKKDRDGEGDKKQEDKARRQLLRYGSPAMADSEPATPISHPVSDNERTRHQYPPVATAVNTAPEKDATVVLQAAKVLGKAVLHDARNIKGKEEGLGALGWNVNSAHEAKRLARSIYSTFKVPGRQYLVPSDFEPAFHHDAEIARKAFRVFDKDNNGDLSRAELKTTLLKVYKERRLLSRSMRDVGIALKTLDQILLFFAMAILFFISLSVFNVNVENSLTSLYSLFIGASFIFKNAASSAFDAVIFLFVTHPFDTGDRCFIDDENFVVKKMGLFATVFTRADGTETYYFNSLLFQKFIINARRSGKTFENLTMQVAWRTPLEKLDQLEKCMNEWLQTEENRWFEPSTSVTLQHIDYQRFLEITIGIGHNGTWQDWGMRMQRKTTFHAAVQFYCRQLGIVCHASPIPIVWADEDTQDYGMLTPGEEEQPPPSPLPGSVMEVSVEQQEQDGQDMEPALGFKPPLKDRSHLRARKSRSKKAVLRSMGADG
ncbi:hypothetical protein OE88DRAFT_1621194 [Heliocybe sulcata]|uniref:EF-hand domain-containing protein n=1 Tax=Heliocybe sulcata TaxID=5364 RepID=A0A5C3NF87_9AGAM|nr:hypothetical protein OE88DRAFT_1621194 [Heliocybe sulcata]